MKRNLKEEIRSVVNEIELNGIGMVIDTAESIVNPSQDKLLSLFSDTIDKVLDPKPSKPKGGKKVTDIIEITIYNYDKMLRDRKKDLLDNTKSKEQT